MCYRCVFARARIDHAVQHVAASSGSQVCALASVDDASAIVRPADTLAPPSTLHRNPSRLSTDTEYDGVVSTPEAYAVLLTDDG
jgi:hypothetical protein